MNERDRKKEEREEWDYIDPSLPMNIKILQQKARDYRRKCNYYEDENTVTVTRKL